MNYTIRQHKFNPCIVYLYPQDKTWPSYVIKNSDKIEKEYDFYQIPHPAFKSFDTYYNNLTPETIIKLNSNKITAGQIYDFSSDANYNSILVGKLNPKLTTLFDYRSKCNTKDSLNKLINLYTEILKLKDECFKSFGFVHGDFKSNNILVGLNNNQLIQFIDFEFSMLFSSPNSTKTLESNNIVLYLCVPPSFEITGEFGRLFDIYLLALDLKVYYKFAINFLLELEIIFTNTSNPINKSNGFIDFFLISQAIKSIPKSELINQTDNTFCSELFTIRDTILDFNPDLTKFNPLNIPILKSRLEHLKLVIKNLKN